MLALRQTEPEQMLTSALIVDDHPLFCEALSMTLANAVGIEDIATVDRLEGALARISAGEIPDVIVLDLNLPDVNGLDGLVRLRDAVGDTPIVVVSSLTEPRIIRSALRLGACGFVPKHSQRDVFRTAFAAISSGRTWVPEDVLDDEDEGDRGAEVAEKLALLTRQQARILALICAGRMNKQIAWELQIAETTVKAHVTEIMRKLGVVTRTQALLLAQQANLSALLPRD
jgi:DNA-binding NarL/FixJ family response regulator